MALGLDAGGTATRWALADAGGRIVAEGRAAPMSGVQLLAPEPRAALRAALQQIAADCGARLAAAPDPARLSAPSNPTRLSAQSNPTRLSAQSAPTRLSALWAGVTGLDAAAAPAFAALAAEVFGLAPAQVHATSDIELLCQAADEGGAGARVTVLYAGTGAIAAALDAEGALQRAGGRGAVIDDAGSGHWIACQALRAVWRREDEAPGRGAASPLGRALAARIGGGDWAATRAFVYGGTATRGALGELALAVAEAAEDDAVARAILEQAGHELARLVQALAGRVGARPLVLAGRVFDLHPAIEAALAAALPQPPSLQRLATAPQHAAARLAVQLAAQPAAHPAARLTEHGS